MHVIAKRLKEKAESPVRCPDIQYTLISDQFRHRQICLVRQLLDIKQICKAIVWIPFKIGQYDASLDFLELASEAQAFSN